jgi:hypothetical protein
MIEGNSKDQLKITMMILMFISAIHIVLEKKVGLNILML